MKELEFRPIDPDTDRVQKAYGVDSYYTIARQTQNSMLLANIGFHEQWSYFLDTFAAAKAKANELHRDHITELKRQIAEWEEVK